VGARVRALLSADARAQVVVGDEILAARVEDVNTRFLCRELRALGWRVCRVRRPRAAPRATPLASHGQLLCDRRRWAGPRAKARVGASPAAVTAAGPAA
jgi:hypothetical protein